MTSDYIHNETFLLHQMSEGNESAFRKIFSNYYARLVFYAQHLSLSREEAEDAVMETFTRCWLARADFESMPKLRSYLYIVTRNVTIDMIRKHRHHAPVNDTITISDDTAEQERIHAGAIARIMQEIDKLPEKCKQVMLLTYRDGLSTREIAEQLNISPTNVTSQRSRAMTLLKMAFPNKTAAWLISLVFFYANK